MSGCGQSSKDPQAVAHVKTILEKPIWILRGVRDNRVPGVQKVHDDLVAKASVL